MASDSTLLKAFIAFLVLLYVFSSLDGLLSQGSTKYMKWNKVFTKETIINFKVCISGKHLQKNMLREKISNFTLSLAMINYFCWENHLSQAQYYAQILLGQQTLKAPLKGALTSIHNSARHWLKFCARADKVSSDLIYLLWTNQMKPVMVKKSKEVSLSSQRKLIIFKRRTCVREKEDCWLFLFCVKNS